MLRKPPSAFLAIAMLLACQDLQPLLEYRPPQTKEMCAWPIATPVDGPYKACMPLLSKATFDIVTWNAQNFPKSGSTVSHMRSVIEAMDADIIALQEIESSTAFEALVASLPGWSGISGSGFQRLGYLYKEDEVILSEAQELFTGQTYAYPRPALMATATHISGTTLRIINIHLKCCDDGSSIDRRKSAASKLVSYLETSLDSVAVVVLGDMNEELTQPEGNGVLLPFLTASEKYRFADYEIAICGQQHWSFPDWPSHIDHILVTDELFNAVLETRTLPFRNCDDQFLEHITDHHPVLLRLQ